MLIYITIAYFSINIFIAGAYFGDEYKWIHKTSEKIYFLIRFIVMILIGFPYIILIFIIRFIRDIDKVFQIRFFIQFFSTKKYRNIPDYDLIRINKHRRRSNSIRDRVYRYGIKLINKLNNYDPPRTNRQD